MKSFSRSSKTLAGSWVGRVGRAVSAVVVLTATGVAGAQYSSYIPTAVPSATTMLYSAGASTISPGRVGVDRAGNVFFVAHTTGSASILYEIPASSPAATITTPTPLVSGLGALNSNVAFVDGSGTLWVSNGNGTGAALLEIPAANGVPNVAGITANSGYTSMGLPLASLTTACSATSTAPCVWSPSSVNSSLTSLQVADIYSDGAGTLYLLDVADSVSSGAYNRILRFSTTLAGSTTTLMDNIKSNTYAQITVAGDGNLYYCDSATGNSSGGLVSLVSNGSFTTVGNTSNSNLTLVSAIVKVTAATGITSDPWGDLLIFGPTQISEIPIEQGSVLNFADQFNLLLAASGSNSPVATTANNINFGGSIDVHGNFYFASKANVMLTEIGGHNFGNVSVGTEVSTGVPYLNITWDLPSTLQTSLVSTSSPSTLSAANSSYLQSFVYSGQKNYYGGTPYGASSTGSYALMWTQPVHPGLMRGSLSPQGYANALITSDSNGSSDYYNNGAYVASLQVNGIGSQPMFVPGTASKAVTVSQLYTSYAKTANAVGFTPTGVAVDTFGDIFVTDTTNTSLDLDCLSTTSNTAQNYRAGAAANGYTNSYCLTNGLAATNGSNLTGITFKVGATGVASSGHPAINFPTSFTTPTDVTLDGANDAYVLDSGYNTAVVTMMPFATMIPKVVIPSNASVAGLPFSNPQGIAVDGYANLYIADTGNNRIIQGRQYNAAYSQNAVYVSSTTAFGGQTLNAPSGIGLDAAGDLFIADTGNKRIVEYSVTGVASIVTATGTALVAPTSVKVLPSGALVVADSTLGLILIDGGVASVLSTGSITISSTQGLSIDLQGNIYVADPIGGQVVELNVNSPATASFPDTLKPDASGSHTSTETSYIYNDGNASLNFTAAPTVVDNTSSATNEFAVDGNNACTATTTLAANASCGLKMDFTPSSTAVVYTTVTGTATISDSFPAITVVTNPSSGSQAIGTFSTTGSTQKVNLRGNPVVPFTPQAITFTAPAPLTWTGSNQTVTLTATGGASGQPVVFSIVSGAGTLSTANGVTTITVKDIGTTVIAANQAGALANGVYYSAAPQVTQPVVVNPIGTVATPTFSVAGGTYTSVQTVSISDATAGATIYYTTNGNTPTTSSPVYTGTPISVSVTTTIKAIATGAPGYAKSAVATAIYTLNPDFIVTPFVTNFTIPNGLGGSTTVTITPEFGFTGKVYLSCSGLSGKDACSFLDANGNQTTFLNITSTSPVYGSLVIQASETSAMDHHGPSPFKTPGIIVALSLLCGGLRKRRRFTALLLMFSLGAVASILSGCSDVSLTGKTHTSTFQFTATSGSVSHSQTITLNVDNLGN